jgi:hypothetical protein
MFTGESDTNERTETKDNDDTGSMESGIQSDGKE